jgi:hypothetical protein
LAGVSLHPAAGDDGVLILILILSSTLLCAWDKQPIYRNSGNLVGTTKTADQEQGGEL